MQMDGLHCIGCQLQIQSQPQLQKQKQKHKQYQCQFRDKYRRPAGIWPLFSHIFFKKPTSLWKSCERGVKNLWRGVDDRSPVWAVNSELRGPSERAAGGVGPYLLKKEAPPEGQMSLS